MKTLKLILTNLILVFMLVILAGGLVYAEGNIDVNVDVARDNYGMLDYITLQILKDGTVLGIDELNEHEIRLSNADDETKNVILLYVEDGTVSEYFSRADVSYSNGTFKIQIKDSSQTLGSNIANMNIFMTDYDEVEITLTKKIESQNISFDVIPYFTSNQVQYFLRINGAVFNDVEELDIFAGEVRKRETLTGSGNLVALKAKYSASQTYQIMGISSGKVYGGFSVPDINSIELKKLDNDSKVVDIQFLKTTKDGNKTEMSLQEIQNLNWQTLVATNDVTDKEYFIDFSTGNFSDGSKAFINTTTIRLPEEGIYSFVVFSEGLDVFKANASQVGLDFSDVELRRVGFQYMLYYPTSLKELIQQNNGENFKIEITDLNNNRIPNKIVDATWCTDNGLGHEQLFGQDTPLYKYDIVRVHFTCKATSLDETIELTVPPMVEFEDITAKITSVGTIGFFDIEGNEVSMKEISFALKNYNEDEMQIELWHEGGTQNIERYQSVESVNTSYTFDRILGFKNHMETTGNYESVVGDYYKVYLYYKSVIDAERDLPLSIVLYRTNDTSKKIKINVEKPTDAGLTYPYLEKIAGMSFDDIEDLVSLCEELIVNGAQYVDNVELVVPEGTHKDFQLSIPGIYYIREKNGKNEDFEVTTLSNMEYGLLAKAGELTGEKHNNKPLGEYICYDPTGVGTITNTREYDEANCYPFLSDTIYRILNYAGSDITLEFIKVDVNSNNTNDLVEIHDENARDTLMYQSGGFLQRNGIVQGYILYDSSFPSLSSLIARFITTLANGLNYLVQMSLRAVGGQELTTTVDIDSILFNHYPDTSIAFFDSNVGGGTPSKLISLFKNGINNWYNIFRGIAIVGYIVILLYIGVRILLSVGGQKQAQFKELLMHWAVGLIILTLFPYVVKYAIDINNVFVGIVEISKTDILKITNVNNQINMSGFSLPSTADKDNYGAIAQQMDKIPFADNDNSYMAEMARKAHRSEAIADAVVYLIMVWQFIMIVIMYYKRVFTIAFLIAVFPFVTLSYAIDKVADGKAQAFSTWTKEIMINIFIQSIHAVVYVFVLGATYSAGEYSGDWLLSIIGITFLFKGEEILKRIIGQGSQGTVGSLAKTAAKAIITVKATQKVAKSVSDNFIGANSHLGRTVNTYRQWRTEQRTARNMDILAKPAYTPPSGTTLDSYDSSLPSAPPNYDELADDIQVLNNMGQFNDTERIAKAINNVMANRNNNNGDIQKLMNGLNLSDDQLNELAKLRDKATQQYLNGDKSTEEKRAELKAKITADMQARLRIILPELNSPNDINRTSALSPDNQRKANNLTTAMFYMMSDSSDRSTKHKKRNTDFAATKREYENVERKVKSFYNPEEISRKGIRNIFSEEAKTPELSTRAIAKRDSILSANFGTNINTATKEQVEMAESIAIMDEFRAVSDSSVPTADTTKYTAKQYMKAAQYIAEHQNDSREHRSAVSNNFTVSGRDMVSIVSEEITKTYTNVSAEPSGDHRRAIARGAKGDIPTPRDGLGIQKEIAVRNMQSAYDTAQKIVKEEEEEYGTRLYYDSTIDQFEAKDVLSREHHNGYDLDSYIGYIISKREAQNEAEAIAVEDFALEMIDDMPKYANEPTYKGLTQSEHEEYSEDLKLKFMEELTRTGVTTVGAVLTAPVGAGLAIGLSDEESAVAEGLVGAAGGILVGDTIGERAMGREVAQGGKTKKVKILNPYTNEVEEFELKKEGLTKDAALISLIDSGEILRHDDPRLDYYNYNLNKQFIEHKKQKQQAIEQDRRKQMFDEALRNSRNNSGNP